MGAQEARTCTRTRVAIQNSDNAEAEAQKAASSAAPSFGRNNKSQNKGQKAEEDEEDEDNDEIKVSSQDHKETTLHVPLLPDARARARALVLRPLPFFPFGPFRLSVRLLLCCLRSR